MLEIDPGPDGIGDHLAAGDFSEGEARTLASVIEKLQKIDGLEELGRKFSALEDCCGAHHYDCGSETSVH